MKSLFRDLRRVEEFSGRMDGVFSVADLKNLFNETNGIRLNRRIRSLLDAGILSRFSRGIYVTRDAMLEKLPSRIHEGSYLSLASALSRHLMIGTVPLRTVYAVRAGRTRTFTGPPGRIIFVGSRPGLLFGYRSADGVMYAVPEKALLDMLYYYQKGRRYYFDIYADVNISCIHETVIRSYLEKYRNPRFISFVEGYLDDKRSR